MLTALPYLAYDRKSPFQGKKHCLSSYHTWSHPSSRDCYIYYSLEQSSCMQVLPAYCSQLSPFQTLPSNNAFISNILQHTKTDGGISEATPGLPLLIKECCRPKYCHYIQLPSAASWCPLAYTFNTKNYLTGPKDNQIFQWLPACLAKFLVQETRHQNWKAEAWVHNRVLSF